MSTEQRVLAMLTKVQKVQEVKKENLGAIKNKVELGLVDELEYSLQDLDSISSEQKSMLSDFNGEISKITSLVGDLYRKIEFIVTDSNTFTSGRTDMNKLMDIANQLGVPVTDVFQNFDEYTALMQEIDASSELLNEKLTMLDNIGLL